MITPGIAKSRGTAPVKIKFYRLRQVALVLGLVVLLLSAVLPIGCASSSSSADIEEEVRINVLNILESIKDTTLGELSAEISSLDQEIASLNEQLDKLNQVAAPALEWVQVQKAEAEKAGYGGKRTVEAASYLESDKFRNEQFRVVKLQFTSVMLSGSTKYTSVINVENLSTGAVASLEELTKEFESKISALTQQRNAGKTVADTVAFTADDVLGQYQNWRVVKVNLTTYNVSGPGLGLERGVITTGVWTYYFEPENLIPSDAKSDALLKMLKGK